MDIIYEIHPDTIDGIPVLWEMTESILGGVIATVVAGAHGERLDPVWTGEKIEGGRVFHAAFEVKLWTHLVSVTRYEGVSVISIDRIVSKGDGVARLKRVALFPDTALREDISVIPDGLFFAVHDAIKRAKPHSCNGPHYVPHSVSICSAYIPVEA